MKQPTFIAVSVFCLLLASAPGQEAAVETVVDGLTNPFGVAVQPGTGHVFVADSGALRVIRIVDGKIQEVITGFPKDVYGTEKKYDIGPLGLAFVDQNTLIVGGGGQPEGEEILRVYKIPEAGGEPISADKMEGDPQMLPFVVEDKVVGEGNFFGVSIFGDSVYVTCSGDAEKGWLAKADLVDGKLSNFVRAIPTQEKTKIEAPIAITKSPEGYIVVGQMGETAVPGDSILSFYDASNEELADWKYATGLNDISALAYGPNRGRLFATDFNWMDATKGGLFKLVGGEEPGQCKNVRIADFDKPTAMTFDDEGNLYVTICGTAAEGIDKPAGALMKIKGLDEKPGTDE